jgi:hypothetical protein
VVTHFYSGRELSAANAAVDFAPFNGAAEEAAEKLFRTAAIPLSG